MNHNINYKNKLDFFKDLRLNVTEWYKLLKQ